MKKHFEIKIKCECGHNGLVIIFKRRKNQVVRAKCYKCSSEIDLILLNQKPTNHNQLFFKKIIQLIIWKLIIRKQLCSLLKI